MFSWVLLPYFWIFLKSDLFCTLMSWVISLLSFSTFQNRLQFSPILWTLYVFLVSLYYYILYLTLFFLIISLWAWPTSFSVAYLFWGAGRWFKIELSLFSFLGTLQKCAICFLSFLGFAPFPSLILIFSFLYLHCTYIVLDFNSTPSSFSLLWHP